MSVLRKHSLVNGAAQNSDWAGLWKRHNLGETPQAKLVREPENEFDDNTIKYVIDGNTCGYVGKELAARIAPLLDGGWTFGVFRPNDWADAEMLSVDLFGISPDATQDEVNAFDAYQNAYNAKMTEEVSNRQNTALAKQAEEEANRQVQNAESRSSIKRNLKLVIILGAVLLVILIIAISSCSSQSANTGSTKSSTATPTPKVTYTPRPTPTPTPVPVFDPDNYSSLSYEAVARDTNGAKGQKLVWTGKVLQVSKGSGETDLRIATDGKYGDVVLVAYDPSKMTQNVLEDDVVSAYGTSIGIYTYKSTMGASISVPAIMADNIIIQ